MLSIAQPCDAGPLHLRLPRTQQFPHDDAQHIRPGDLPIEATTASTPIAAAIFGVLAFAGAVIMFERQEL